MSLKRLSPAPSEGTLTVLPPSPGKLRVLSAPSSVDRVPSRRPRDEKRPSTAKERISRPLKKENSVEDDIPTQSNACFLTNLDETFSRNYEDLISSVEEEELAAPEEGFRDELVESLDERDLSLIVDVERETACSPTPSQPLPPPSEPVSEDKEDSLVVSVVHDDGPPSNQEREQDAPISPASPAAEESERPYNPMKLLMEATSDLQLKEELERVLRLDEELLNKTKQARELSSLSEAEERQSTRPDSPTDSARSGISSTSKASGKTLATKKTFLTEQSGRRRKGSEDSSSAHKVAAPVKEVEPLCAPSRTPEIAKKDAGPATNDAQYSKVKKLIEEEEIRVQTILSEDLDSSISKTDGYQPSLEEQSRLKDIDTRLMELLEQRHETRLMQFLDSETPLESQKKVNIVAEMREERERKQRMRDIDSRLESLSKIPLYRDVLGKDADSMQRTVADLINNGREEIEMYGRPSQERLEELLLAIAPAVQELRSERAA